MGGAAGIAPETKPAADEDGDVGRPGGGTDCLPHVARAAPAAAACGGSRRRDTGNEVVKETRAEIAEETRDEIIPETRAAQEEETERPEVAEAVTMRWRRSIVSALVCATSVLSAGRAAAQESKIVADFKREGTELSTSCGDFSVKAVGGCAYSLLTLHPVHIAVGNLAPQNGFSFGAAFSERYTPNESWRMSWNADAVASLSGSWRSGLYMKMVHTPATSGVVVIDSTADAGALGTIAPREFAVLDFFVQSTSLKSVGFFGLGPDSAESGRSVFGEGQTMVGGSAAYPLGGIKGIGWLRPTVVGGVMGRFVDMRSGEEDDVPSIEDVYAGADVPGLGIDTRFLNLRESIRFRPVTANGWLRFNYLVAAEQFRAHETGLSFNRWTVDLKHEIPLFNRVASSPAFSDALGPNECETAAASVKCAAPVTWSRNRQGTLGMRVVATTSDVSDSNAVPFYLQPTLGGSNINNERLLASYDDYRFRAPHMIAVQSNVEFSLWGPIGVFAGVEGGKVADRRSDLGFDDLRASGTVGLTLRAGNFPLVNLSFSWGGEGHHVIGEMSSTLLGGGARPSLF
jgi:hypothetical protein